MSMIFDSAFVEFLRTHADSSIKTQPKAPMMKSKSADLIRETVFSCAELEYAYLTRHLEQVSDKYWMGCFYGIIRNDYTELARLASNEEPDTSTVWIDSVTEVSVQTLCVAFCIAFAYQHNVRSLCAPAQRNMCRSYLRRTCSFLANLLLKYYDSKPAL